jgi:transcriptional regulator with XRE-family HTH domain
VAGTTLDLDRLATFLRGKIEEEKLTIREAGRQIGCSAATLTRLLQGSKAETIPDSVNLIRAASWLKMRLSEFEPGRPTRSSTIADVELHLRALPNLAPVDAEGLIAMVKAAYDAAKLRAPKRTTR